MIFLFEVKFEIKLGLINLSECGDSAVLQINWPLEAKKATTTTNEVLKADSNVVDNNVKIRFILKL